MASYYYWARDRDIPLFLILENSSGSGATGLTPAVTIRRDADNFYWTGTVFTATPTPISMTEFDSTNNPGLYVHLFDNSSIDVEETYRVYYSHQASSPRGISNEIHIATNEVRIPSSSGIVPVGPDTVLGRLEAMKSSTGEVALANADAVWDEPSADHCIVGSTGEVLKSCTALSSGASQVTIEVEDDSATPIPGAQIDIYDATNTVFIGRVFTTVGGDVVIAIDDGTYNLRVFAVGVSFTVPEVIVVSGDGTFTISGVLQTNIFIPSAPNKCVIFGRIQNAACVDITGACVQAFAVVDPPQAVSGIQLGDPIAETTTDQDGFFTLELIRGSIVRFSIEPAGVDFIRTVPDAPSQDVTTWV